MTEISVDEYLRLTKQSYDNRGGLEHQREAIKTASGRRIRERMVKDIKGGAVLPPLVIGVVGEPDAPYAMKDASISDIIGYISTEHAEKIAIIDGMQRTAALLEAVDTAPEVAKHTIRMEIWLAGKVESLIYRMLILNSGQIPWNLKQQLRVVYQPLVLELYEKVDFSRLLGPGERRWKGGEFSSDHLIETYIAFGLRKTEVDTQENLAEEFSKLDISESIREDHYSKFFFPIIQMMVDIDRVFSNFEPEFELKSQTVGRVKRIYERGKNIFDTQPPRIGFVVANALQIFGRIGMTRSSDEARSQFERIFSNHNLFVDRLERMSKEELGAFLSLDVLQETLSTRPTSAVGRWERAFWERAFKALLEEDFEVPSMVPCWRAG